MRMKETVRNILCYALVLVCFGCKESAEKPLVVQVTDLTGDEEVVSDLVYDNDDRIISYGNTPIAYESGRVTVGEMVCQGTGTRLHSAVFKLVKGKAKESRARCMLKIGCDVHEADKATIYEYEADTLCIRSDYHAVDDHRFLRHTCGKYIYDKDGNLKEVIMDYREADDSVSNCHTYYSYDAHIGYQSNLNLLAYVMDREGLDSFFYFLLNLGPVKNNTLLPNDIGYCLNHGSDEYNVHANYRLENESPVRIEVLRDCTKLLSRIDLVYKDSN